MPYVTKDQRNKVDGPIEELASAINDHPQWHPAPALPDGVVNYAITRLLQKTILGHDRTYAAFERAIGVLECAKLELYRRMVAPYEDKKSAENGDAY